jgi:hypothetical protein
MDLHYPGELLPEVRPEVRLRKMLTKDIGILYYELPRIAILEAFFTKAFSESKN